MLRSTIIIQYQLHIEVQRYSQSKFNLSIYELAKLATGRQTYKTRNKLSYKILEFGVYYTKNILNCTKT